MAKRLGGITGITILTFILFLGLMGCGSGGGDNGGGGGGTPGPALTGVQITPTNPTIALGTSMQLTATGVFAAVNPNDITDQVTWSSSDTAICTVSNTAGSKGLVTCMGGGIGVVTISASMSGQTGSTNLTVTPAQLVSIAVTPTNPSIPKGFQQQFAATGTFTDNTTQDMTASVTWSSSVPAVANVSNSGGSEGLATGVGVGTATITATDPGTSISGSTNLTVTSAQLVSIAVTPTNPSIPKGLQQQFAATGTFTDSSTQDITTFVAWSSSNTGVATISNAPGSQGLATGVSIGTTTITATDPASSISGVTNLTVTKAVPLSCAIAPSNPSIPLGHNQQFTATAAFSDNSSLDVTTLVTWSSSDTTVAAVSNAGGSQGLATSVAMGTATITATDPVSGVSCPTILTVTPAQLVSIAVTPPSPSITLGSTQQFTATGTFTDSSTQNITTSVTWSSGFVSVATISNAAGSEGLATSVSAGTTTITATDPVTSINGTASLTVTTVVTLTSIAVTPPNPSIALASTQQFMATGTFSDSTTQDITTSVTWSSSDSAVATVSNAGGSKGLATSVAAGTTTITALDPGTSVSGATSLTVSGTNVFIGDFEGGFGNWGGDAMWEVGAPTAGPTACHGGAGCAGTILGGNYPEQTDGRLISPAIPLPAITVGEEIDLSAWSWFSISHNGTTNTLWWDYWEIQVQEETAPGVWGPWTTLLKNSGDSGAWTHTVVDLSAHAGKKVRLGFLLRGFVPFATVGVSTGWYIDDVSIDVIQAPAAVPYAYDFEGGFGSWGGDGMWEVGTPTIVGPSACHGGALCAGTVLDGNYPEQINGRLMSPAVQLPSIGPIQTLNLGAWSWFSISHNGTTNTLWWDYWEIQVQEETAPGVWGPWTTMLSNSGDSGTWTHTVVDLSAYAGKKVRMGFLLRGFVPFATVGVSTGWYIDDVTIQVQ